MRSLVAGLLVVLVVSLASVAGQWGIGISSEPLDIAGGGFFVDSFVDLPIPVLRQVADLSMRPSFGFGPLPINPQILFLDLPVVMGVSLGEMNAYIGMGPSFMMTTNLSWTDIDALVIGGIDSIRITDRITIYIELKVRGAGFFMSPGVGFVFDF